MQSQLFSSFILCFVFFIFGTQSYGQQTWTLEKCIEYAHNSNLQVELQDLNKKYTEANLRQSKLDLYPNLNASVGQNFSFGRSEDPFTGISVSQNLGSNSYSLSTGVTVYNGRVKMNTLRQYQQELELREAEKQEMKDAITLLIMSGYLDILINEEQGAIDQYVIELSEKRLEDSRLLVESGIIPEGDLLELEAQMANDQLSLINTENRVEIAYLNLIQLLELPVSERENFSIAKPTEETLNDLLVMPDINEESIFQTASSSLASITKNDWAQKQAETGLKIAKGAYIPSLTLIGDISTAGVNASNIEIFDYGPFGEQLNINFRQYIGASLNIPIFNNGQIKRGVEYANLNLLSKEIEHKQNINSLRKEIAEIVANLNASARQFEAAQKNYSASEKAFNFTESKFDAGQSNSLEFSTARNSFLQAGNLLISAKYNYLFALKSLDFYMNRPLKL